VTLKETFLSYVELQRNANNYKEAYGIDDYRTVDAYARANLKKREMLELIEAVEK
jgi:hypothetical protein